MIPHLIKNFSQLPNRFKSKLRHRTIFRAPKKNLNPKTKSLPNQPKMSLKPPSPKSTFQRKNSPKSLPNKKTQKNRDNPLPKQPNPHRKNKHLQRISLSGKKVNGLWTTSTPTMKMNSGKTKKPTKISIELPSWETTISTTWQLISKKTIWILPSLRRKSRSSLSTGSKTNTYLCFTCFLETKFMSSFPKRQTGGSTFIPPTRTRYESTALRNKSSKKSAPKYHKSCKELQLSSWTSETKKRPDSKAQNS